MKRSSGLIVSGFAPDERAAATAGPAMVMLAQNPSRGLQRAQGRRWLAVEAGEWPACVLCHSRGDPARTEFNLLALQVLFCEPNQEFQQTECSDKLGIYSACVELFSNPQCERL